MADEKKHTHEHEHATEKHTHEHEHDSEHQHEHSDKKEASSKGEDACCSTNDHGADCTCDECKDASCNCDDASCNCHTSAASTACCNTHGTKNASSSHSH